MERAILQKILLKHYSEDSVKSIFCKRMKPSFNKMILLNKEHDIPFTAWEDIDTFIGKSVTDNKNKSEIEKVS